MLFNSLLFVGLFLPAAYGGLFAVGRWGGRGLATLWLIGASIVFYAWGAPQFLLVLAASIVGNNLCLRAMDRWPGGRTILLALGIAGNLGGLFWFKYAAPLAGFLHAHGWIRGELPAIVLPLGISFFTFSQIGLLIDRREERQAAIPLCEHALFMGLFPHLVAGPLLRHRELMPQFAARAWHRFRCEDFAIGASIFAIGLVKKAACADSLAPIAEGVFAAPGGFGALAAWQGALAYALQLYFDFSGYSDMAIGLARMIGIRFPANFDSPYKARSIIEYWQRWHMTLTRWLTLYIYAPLALRIARRRAVHASPRAPRISPGGFLHGVAGPIMLTMTLAGIWPGAGLTFLAFGVLHGAYLTINHAWRCFRPARWKPRAGRLRALGATGLTFGCVLAGAVVFRAPTLPDAARVLGAMTGLHGLDPGAAANPLTLARDWTLIGVLAAIVFFAPNTQQIMRDADPILGGRLRPVAFAWALTPRWSIACGAAMALGLLAVGGSSEFLYFQF